MTLDRLPAGSSGKITAVTLCKTAPMGDPIEIRLRGYSLTIRREDAEKIGVEKL